MLASTQDLISRFHLLSAYNKYVRPYAPPVGSIQGTIAPPPGPDKGKGKEREIPMQDSTSLSSPVPATPAAGNDGDDDDMTGKGEKKLKNYRYLIKGIPGALVLRRHGVIAANSFFPGKHSMKKDDYLTTMMQIPPKQKLAIKPFDLKTQREAFSVSLEGLKGVRLPSRALQAFLLTM